MVIPLLTLKDFVNDEVKKTMATLLERVKDYLVKNLDLLDPSILKDKTLCR